jgi:hypothetical protein
VTPHFRMAEFAARLMLMHDPSAAREERAEVPDEDGGGLSRPASAVPATIRELQVGGNYYVNRNVRLMGNVIVPLDQRTTPSSTLVARLQFAF